MNQANMRGAGRGNCFVTAGRGSRYAGNNQTFARGPGKGNISMANNRGFNRGGPARQVNAVNAGYGRGYGRNATFGRGFGRGYNPVQTETIEEPVEK